MPQFTIFLEAGSATCIKVRGGVDWSHYKHPLPEHVYDRYMRYWGDVTFK
ncbi:MAG: hypothetical protein ACXVIA_07105 [Halobacteriota archaeon]